MDMINKMVNRDGITLFIGGVQERGMLKDIAALKLDPVANRAASLAFDYIDMSLPDKGLELLTLFAESNGWGVNLNAPVLKNGSHGWFNKSIKENNNHRDINIEICPKDLSGEEVLFELFRQMALAEMYWNVVEGRYKPEERRFYFNKITLK